MNNTMLRLSCKWNRLPEEFQALLKDEGFAGSVVRLLPTARQRDDEGSTKNTEKQRLEYAISLEISRRLSISYNADLTQYLKAAEVYFILYEQSTLSSTFLLQLSRIAFYVQDDSPATLAVLSALVQIPVTYMSISNIYDVRDFVIPLLERFPELCTSILKEIIVDVEYVLNYTDAFAVLDTYSDMFENDIRAEEHNPQCVYSYCVARIKNELRLERNPPRDSFIGMLRATLVRAAFFCLYEDIWAILNIVTVEEKKQLSLPLILDHEPEESVICILNRVRDYPVDGNGPFTQVEVAMLRSLIGLR